MFEFIRTHQRLMQMLLLVLVFPAFALFGIEGYTRFFGSGQNLAEVEGRAITQQEFDGILRQQIENMQRNFGASFDPKLIDTPEQRKMLLDSLIDERLTVAEAIKRKLTVSDAAVRQALLAQPLIQQLRKPDGSIDLDRYRELLAAQGMTPEQYDARLRFTLAVGKPTEVMTGTGIASRVVAERLARGVEQERAVQTLMLSPADYAARVQLDDAAVRDYYDKHTAQFSVPEQAKIEYLVLSAEDIAAGIHPSDADLHAAYDRRQAEFAGQEERRASHILIAVGRDAKPAERQAAKEKAVALLDEVRKHPGDFAAIAQKSSQDPGSAKQGGDLGFFKRGAMVKVFEDAAFSLKEGQISDLVESDFGYHIIKLTGIKAPKLQSFDEVKAKLEADVRREQAAKRFAEASEAFSNLVYDQYDSLKPAADKFKLKIETADGVTRQGPGASGDKRLANAKLLGALFSDDGIKKKRNTEAVQVTPDTLLSARIAEYHAAQTRPFDTVKAEVRAQAAAARALAMAKEAGADLLKKAQAGQAVDGFGKSAWVSMRSRELPRDALAAIIRADASKLPATVGVDLGDKGYALYRITEVKMPERLDDAKVQAAMNNLAGNAAESELRGYRAALRERSKVKVYKQPESGTASQQG